MNKKKIGYILIMIPLIIINISIFIKSVYDIGFLASVITGIVSLFLSIILANGIIIITNTKEENKK